MQQDKNKLFSESMESIDRILEIKKPASELGKSGIYFLIKDNVIVYVGQTRNSESRIYSHFNDASKEFDSYSFIPCHEDELNDMEAYYVVTLNTEYNMTMPPNNVFKSVPQLKAIFGKGALDIRKAIKKARAKIYFGSYYMVSDIAKYVDSI